MAAHLVSKGHHCTSVNIGYFSNSAETTMKTINLKEALKLFGATNIEISKGTYNYRSGFFDKDGQLFYFIVEDLRDENPSFLIKTAQHRKDYTGGTNTYPMGRFLEEQGLKLVIPRTRQDYN